MFELNKGLDKLINSKKKCGYWGGIVKVMCWVWVERVYGVGNLFN